MLERKPNWDLLFKVGRIPSPVKRKETKSPVTIFAPNFSASEFARLFVLLVTDPQARKALEESVLEMTRGELEAGVNRDLFLSTVVASQFNDPDYKPVYDFEGVVEDVDVSEVPQTEGRG